MTIIIALVGLSVLIIIHELGHMLTAKAFGVRVPEFGVGFGPALLKKKFGNTVYSLRIILLGGFVKMAGMEDIASVAHERGELAPDTYPSKPPWQRALIIFAGPFANLLAAVLILAGIFMFTGQVTEIRPVVSGVETGTLADEVGLQPGDRLLSVDGERLQGWEGFVEAVGEKEPGQEVSLTVQRNGSERTFSGELGTNPNDPDAALVGVEPEVVRETYGPLESLWLGVQRTAMLTVAYLGGLYSLVTGQMNFFDNVSGPVGIVGASSESVSAGLYPLFLAVISLILAIMNLLPILPLDGGHLLFIVMEKLRGRPVSQQTMNKVAALGIAMFLTLFLLATYADLSKIITGQPFIPG